jgi:hypothetical protein
MFVPSLSSQTKACIGNALFDYNVGMLIASGGIDILFPFKVFLFAGILAAIVLGVATFWYAKSRRK